MRKRLGDILIEAGLITSDQLKSALEIQKTTGARLGEVLVDLGYTSQTDIAKTLASQLGIPFVSFSDLRIDSKTSRLIQEHVARQYRALPVSQQGNKLIVAVADPLNVFALDDIGFMTGKEVEPMVMTESGLDRAIQQAYQMEGLDFGAQSEETIEDDALEVARLREMVEEAPVVRLVNSIVDRAILERASDIHIEPQESTVRVRYRVDGALHDVMFPPKSSYAATVSRIKIMSEMDISIRRTPQDGRIRLKDKGRDVDLRVSTLPTVHGEKVVIRVLDKSGSITKLEQLGFLPDSLQRYNSVLTQPYGMVLVTGPTGSGKTTTLTATLHKLNKPDANIITIEDPVEYEIPGVNQVQVNAKAGLDFASGLRSMLRQDPNIIMVGEVRDQETAEIAIRAALTGHLVFSTLHTNDAASALTRLTDMGVESFLIASSVLGILAQRLVRCLCPRCKEPYELAMDAPERFSMGLPLDQPVTLYKPHGCNECGNNGFRGRIGIFEVLNVTPSVREMVTQRMSPAMINREAIKHGMRPLLQDGVEKALKGMTTLEEVRKVAFVEEI